MVKLRLVTAADCTLTTLTEPEEKHGDMCIAHFAKPFLQFAASLHGYNLEPLVAHVLPYFCDSFYNIYN